jgi:hypothetical protein
MCKFRVEKLGVEERRKVINLSEFRKMKMISLEKKYLIMKKIIEYLKKKNGKALMTNVVGEVIYLADSSASWRDIENIVYELQKKGILEISPVWHNEYEVTLKQK